MAVSTSYSDDLSTVALNTVALPGIDGGQALARAEMPRTGGRSGKSSTSIRDLLPDSLLGQLLEERGFAPCELFDRFIHSNPSFSPNTTHAYLTQISRYLVDWLVDYAEFPKRYEPLVRGFEIVYAYREADKNLKAGERTPLFLAQQKKQLDSENLKLWKAASAAPGQSGSSESEFIRPRFRKERQRQLLPDTGIARGDQAMLVWLLNEYQPLLDQDFWSAALSNEAIGTLARDYLEDGASSSTVCLRMTAINHFREFLAQEYSFQVEKRLKQPRREETQEIVHEVSDLNRVSEFLTRERKREGDYRSYRNELLFELCYYTGARASELCHLETKDVRLDRGVITLSQKNNKIRTFPLHPVLVEKFETYLKERERFIATLEGRGDGRKLFLSTRGNALDRVRLYEVFTSIGEKAGLQLPLGPHSIRRSAACALYDRGVPLHVIQQFLGHSKLKTTLLYVSYGQSDAFQLVLDFHPLSDTPSTSLRAKSLRNGTKRNISIILDTSNREGIDPERLKVRSEKYTTHSNPGFLDYTANEIAHSEKFALQKFTSLIPTSSDQTKRQYQNAVRHFLVERFHNLELDEVYRPVTDWMLRCYLADRLDWMVRTGEIEEISAIGLFEEIREAGSDMKSYLSNASRRRGSDAALLCHGIIYTETSDRLELSLPYELHLEKSSKDFGQREKLFGDALLSHIDAVADEQFWRTIFSPECIGRVYEQQMSRGVRKSSINKTSAALRVYGAYLEASAKLQPGVDQSIVSLPSLTRDTPRPQLVLTEDEVKKLFSTLSKNTRSGPKGERSQALHDQALLYTLYTTAARAEAVAGLKLKDISWERSGIYFHEKGNREVFMPLLPDTKAALLSYLEDRGLLDRRGRVKVSEVNTPLFLSRKSGDMNDRKMQRILTEWAKKADIDITMRGTFNLSPHDIRRSALIHMVNNGAAPTDAQRIAGHRDLETTAGYLSHGIAREYQIVTEFLPQLKPPSRAQNRKKDRLPV